MSENTNEVKVAVIAKDESVSLKTPSGVALVYKPIALDEEMDLMCALPANAESRMSYVNTAFICAGVREFDGAPQPFPTTENQVRAMFKRLGREVVTTVMTHIGKSSEVAGDDTAKLKNS